MVHGAQTATGEVARRHYCEWKVRIGERPVEDIVANCVLLVHTHGSIVAG